MKLIPRLKEKYIKEIVPTLCKNLSFSNKMQAPKLVKIVLNMEVKKHFSQFLLLDLDFFLFKILEIIELVQSEQVKLFFV